MLQKFLKFKIITVSFAIGYFLVVLGWIWSFLALKGDKQPLILHFSNSGGISQIGGVKDLTTVAVFSLIFLTADFLLALELEERDWFLGKMLAAGAVFLSILIFIGFAAIIGVN